MFCPHCGNETAAGAAFCASCGRALTTDAAAGSAVALVYAGFWARFLAVFIDGLLLGLVGVLIFGANDRGGITSMVLGWLYFALMESSERRATFGKQLMGLKVVDLQGNRISFGRATGRYFAKWLSAITLLIGYIMAAFTPKKQALHDVIAGTLVLPRDVEVTVTPSNTASL